MRRDKDADKLILLASAIRRAQQKNKQAAVWKICLESRQTEAGEASITGSLAVQ
jgi:hypothetical protein